MNPLPNPLPRRALLGLIAVIDIALHSRAHPVSAKALAARHDLPPRHLEPVLQIMVRQGILKGLRGPHGGYELARERRRLTAGDIVRTTMTMVEDDNGMSAPKSPLAAQVIEPVIQGAIDAFLADLDRLTINDLCRRAEEAGVVDSSVLADFTI